MGIEEDDIKFLQSLNDAPMVSKPFAFPQLNEEKFSFTLHNSGSQVMRIGDDLITLYNKDGGVIADISLKDGTVAIHGDVNEAAQQFWKAVGILCSQK